LACIIQRDALPDDLPNAAHEGETKVAYLQPARTVFSLVSTSEVPFSGSPVRDKTRARFDVAVATSSKKKRTHQQRKESEL
jgi:hypothetical protein